MLKNSYLIVNANIITPITENYVISNPNIAQLKNYSILIENNKIKKISPYKEIQINKDTTIIDINNKYIVPGFIDCHTHLLFDGKRIEDFIKRIQGQTYQEIALSGGGINYTVNQTINSPILKKLLIERIKKLYENGTTIIEIKNGYAIDIKKEIEHLEIINEVSKLVTPIIIPTFLAHIPPPNFENYLAELKQLIPQIRKLTKYFDIFCDKTAFSVEQTLKIIDTIKDYDFYLRFHTNEFQEDGLIEKIYLNYSTNLKIKSFDHLLVVSENTIEIIKKIGAFAVIMPSTSWFLAKNYSPIDKLIEKEIPICLASDYNAGSSNVMSMLMVANLSAIYLKLKPEQILAYITTNPSLLLNLQAGQIREGYLPIFNVLNTDDWREFCFSLDQSLIKPYNFMTCISKQSSILP